VNQDNTISVENRILQLEKTRRRNTLAGQTVIVHEHLDGHVSIRYGPHVIAQYPAANCRRKHRNGVARHDYRLHGRRHDQQGFVLRNRC